MNNPNYQGERRVVEDPQKDLLSRLPKGTHVGANSVPLSLTIGHAPSYQVTKTLARQIAPAPGSQPMSSLAKPLTGHSLASLNQAVHKKVSGTEIQKVPLTLTASTPLTTVQSGTPVSNIIPVQISTTTAASSHNTSTLHVPNVSSIVRGAVPQTIHHSFSHLPRGMVPPAAQLRTGSSVNIQRQTLPTSIQVPSQAAPLPLNLQGPIRSVIPQMVRQGTPPANRPGSPVISIGTVHPTDRANISLHSGTTVTTTPSIQITLQASSRANTEPGTKPLTTLQAGKAPSLSMSATPKVMTHSMPHHPTMAAKGNRGQPMPNASVSTVTVSLSSTTTVTIPIISTGTTSSSIPIAKVTPQRQHTVQTHSIPTTSVTPLEHQHPQPQQAHSQASGHPQAQGQTQGTSQPATSLYIPQPHRASPIVTTVISNVTSTESRDTSLPTMPFFPPYMLSPENPYYQQLMRYQVAAVAQAQTRPGLISQPTASIAASLQAATNSVAQTTGGSVRYNPTMMVMQESRQSTPPATHTQFHSTSTEANITKVTNTSSDTVPMLTSQPLTSGMTVGAVAAVASSLYTASTQNSHSPQIGQPAPNTPSSTPVNNPSASPRPSILRKRTNEGISTVKKQLAMTTAPDVQSPRPEPRPDSTPQSNMSSPKTPASGESQSSTDTAMSSEANTPTQPHGETKVKQEPPDPHENGFTNTPEASPRKRRKQLLQATEEMSDTPVNVFDKLVEACVKEEDGADDSCDEDQASDDEDKPDIRREYVDEEGVRWTVEKTHSGYSLLNFYNISWKPKNNHFVRYVDVKAKDERRPTVNELSNQKGVIQKASGWKLYHMAAQIEDLVELERDLNTKLQALQALVGPTPPLRHSLMEDESGMLHELTQGNIQRCKLITDQLGEAKSSMLKVLDHKHKISEIISKHMSKRPIKKKERT